MYASGRCIYTQVGAFTRARRCLRIPLWVCIVLYTHVAGSEHACTPRGRDSRIRGCGVGGVRLRASGSAYTHAGCAVYAVGAFMRALAVRRVSYT